MTAIKRYNGPFDTTLRKFLTEHPAERHRNTLLMIQSQARLPKGLFYEPNTERHHRVHPRMPRP